MYTLIDSHITCPVLSTHAWLSQLVCVIAESVSPQSSGFREDTVTLSLRWDWTAKAQNSFSFGNADEFSFPLTLRPSGFFQRVCLNFQTDLSSADLRRSVYLTPNSYSWRLCEHNSFSDHEIRPTPGSFKWWEHFKIEHWHPIHIKTSDRGHYYTSIAKQNRLSKHSAIGRPNRKSRPPNHTIGLNECCANAQINNWNTKLN